METLFNQFLVVFKLAETMSCEVLQAVLLIDSANKETFPNQVIVLTRDGETVLRELLLV